MKAAPVFDALTALQLALSAQPSPECRIPHGLWMKLLHAEIGLRQALKEASLQFPVEVEAEELIRMIGDEKKGEEA